MHLFHPSPVQSLSLPLQQRLRQALVAGIAVYGVMCLRSPETFRLIDFVNLAVHETGHLVFAPFGELITALGGTLLQLIMPLCFVVSFHRRNDRFAASIVLAWVAQNFWNISVYVADARAQVLPLVGGGEHDWAYILGHFGVLAHDQSLARSVHLAGTLLFGYAMFRALHWSGHIPGSQAHSGRSGGARPHLDASSAMNEDLLARAQMALAQIEPMAAQGWAPAESIAKQLRWCVAFASGLPHMKRPGPFSMGLIATRELDMYGDKPELATLINQVQRDVENALG